MPQPAAAAAGPTAPASTAPASTPATVPQGEAIVRSAANEPLPQIASAPSDVSAPPVAVPKSAATTKPAPVVPDLQFVRISEQKYKFIALDIASRDFVRADGSGPRVGLVAVAHIAEPSFYQAVQNLLDTYDLVLYESVKPAGAGGAGGATDRERIASTKAAMQYVGGMIEAYRSAKQEYPPDIEAVKQLVVVHDSRLATWLDTAMTDAWGHRLIYQLTPDKPNGYGLASLGADGAAGGEGVNADLTLDDHPPDPLQLSKEDNLQVQLANALNLKFQLDALSYHNPKWRCSDMAMDEVTRALAARGIDFGPIGGTLAGSTLPAKIMSFLLNLIKVADTFMEGQIADTFKVIMIQMLGDPALIERGLNEQMGAGFSEVIVQQRNQRALDDLKTIAEGEKPIKSVAILYGAAHMPDMVSKLVTQLGYQPVAGPEGEHWMTAIKVDFTKSAVSPEEIAQIRLMMKQMMRR